MEYHYIFFVPGPKISLNGAVRIRSGKKSILKLHSSKSIVIK